MASESAIQKYWHAIAEDEIPHTAPMVETFVQVLIEGINEALRRMPDLNGAPATTAHLQMAEVECTLRRTLKEAATPWQKKMLFDE